MSETRLCCERMRYAVESPEIPLVYTPEFLGFCRRACLLRCECMLLAHGKWGLVSSLLTFFRDEPITSHSLAVVHAFHLAVSLRTCGAEKDGSGRYFAFRELGAKDAH